jgi:vancomycin resistance protein YoaR
MSQDLAPALRAPRRRRRVLGRLGAVVVVVALVVSGVLLALPVHGQVAPGTRIAGLAVGGMDAAHLRALISGPLSTQVERSVHVEVGDDSGDGGFDVDPAAIGITLDAAGTEQEALATGRGSLPERLARLRGRHRDLQPLFRVDLARARAAMRRKLTPYQRAAKDATLTFAAPVPLLTGKQDASFSAEAAEGQVQASVSGRAVDAESAVTTLRQAVLNGRLQIRLPVVTTRAKVSSADAAGIDQLIGTFTTEHPCCAPRVTNIHRIAEIVDGAMIAPGATFSLNQAAGRRTSQNGFVAAPAIAEGELVEQVGGGVSQFSTTLFNAAWFAGLTIVRHQPHSKYISRYPPGREATLDYDTIDQVIRNDTDTPIMIRTATTATSVTVALYGHTGERTVTSLTGEEIPRAEGGFSVSVQRRVDDAGTVTKQDSLSWTYTGLD